MITRRRSIVVYSLIVPLAGGLGALVTMRHLDTAGSAFFDTGKEIVTRLDRLSAAAKSRAWEEVSAAFAAEYAGKELGLQRRKLVESKDGLERLRFSGGDAAFTRDPALAEWTAYIESFDAIENFDLHLHQLEEWKGPIVRATIRMEMIGRPHGRPESCIDRAYIYMTFNRGPNGLEIVGAAMKEGERIISDRPQFRNIAHEAGIDFLNRYYPGYFDPSLKFVMLRYGPGGITTVDYDDDGFYDLFVPDGVESKLFRNLGNGRFEDVTAAAGLSGLDGVSVAVFADYDNDGHKDVFVSRTFKPNQLFHNNGDGTYTDVTKKSGIGEDCCTTVASWGDYIMTACWISTWAAT